MSQSSTAAASTPCATSRCTSTKGTLASLLVFAAVLLAGMGVGALGGFIAARGAREIAE